MIIVLLGAPGAGKGTLAGALKDELGVHHISTGDLIRAEIKAGSPIGLEIKRFVESGGLVPDEVVTRMIEGKVKSTASDNRGYMFDGFPRTGAQATDLDKVLSANGLAIDFALYMEASIDVVLQRLTGRRVCRKCGALFHLTNMPPKKDGVCDVCGGELYQRADDNKETIMKRMSVYNEQTMPIIDFYKKQSKLKTINADSGAEDVRKALLQILNGKKS
ncbi:MAG: adenylate kinase [Candidatus Omnitrophica bacterium]|nr:adenylate kinase [Candidatus Omnitrophota bacterium]